MKACTSVVDDAFAHDARGGLVGFERDVLGGLHQRELVLGLDHAATGGARRSR
jgi:hypothetical protein